MRGDCNCTIVQSRLVTGFRVTGSLSTQVRSRSGSYIARWINRQCSRCQRDGVVGRASSSSGKPSSSYLDRSSTCDRPSPLSVSKVSGTRVSPSLILPITAGKQPGRMKPFPPSGCELHWVHERRTPLLYSIPPSPPISSHLPYACAS